MSNVKTMFKIGGTYMTAGDAVKTAIRASGRAARNVARGAKRSAVFAGKLIASESKYAASQAKRFAKTAAGAVGRSSKRAANATKKVFTAAGSKVKTGVKNVAKRYVENQKLKVYGSKLYKKELAKAQKQFKRAYAAGARPKDWKKLAESAAFKNTKRRIRNRRINKVVAVGLTAGAAYYGASKLARRATQDAVDTYKAISNGVSE